MENIKVEVKDIDVTKEETQSVEEVKRQILSALNGWDMFTMDDK
jgi:hypothetical protein